MHSPEEYRRIWLPYAVKKIDDKIGGWIPLNREYKPLGMPTEGWVEYEDVPKALRIKRITIAQQKVLHQWCEQAGPWRPNDLIWLYHDGSVPTSSVANWKAYQERLFLLSRLDCFGSDR